MHTRVWPLAAPTMSCFFAQFDYPGLTCFKKGPQKPTVDVTDNRSMFYTVYGKYLYSICFDMVVIFQSKHTPQEIWTIVVFIFSLLDLHW